MPDLTPSYLVVIVLAVISGLTTLIGVALALAFGRKPTLIAAGIGFSAGIMLLVSTLELLPEAYHASGWVTVLLSAGGGAVFIAALHFILPHTHLVEENGLFWAKRMCNPVFQKEGYYFL